MNQLRFGWLICILLVLPLHSQNAETVRAQDWRVYGGNPDATHYSPLKQINRSNAKQLELAWSYDTGETGGLQTSPIEIGGVLYGISPSQKVFAVDAASGKLKWKFDSGIVGTQPARGLAYWASADNQDRRIIVGVMNFVYELNAETGKPIPTFGTDGRIDLREGLGRDVATGFIALTSPAVVYKDLFIVGGRLPETLPALPGPLRLAPSLPFVGRARELAELRALLPSAGSEGGRVALLGGESGVGKSRLVRELAHSHPQVPVVLMSGYAAGQLEAMGIAAPCGVLSKPRKLGAQHSTLLYQRPLTALNTTLVTWPLVAVLPGRKMPSAGMAAKSHRKILPAL